MAVPEYCVHYLEIVTSDVKSTCDLFAQAYGWRFQHVRPELGNAYVAELPDGTLCGIRASLHPDEKPIVRTYLRVHNLQQAVEDAARMGAKILLDHMEIAGHGFIAIYELGEIQQGIWQVP